MTRATTAGGGSTCSSRTALARRWGLGTATVVTAPYTILAASIIGVFGYFANNTTIDSWLHVSIPVWAQMFGVLGVDRDGEPDVTPDTAGPRRRVSISRCGPGDDRAWAPVRPSEASGRRR
jgi:hypothetical protein